MIYFFIPFLFAALVLIFDFLHYYFIYINSTYGRESGNSFLQTYYDKDKRFYFLYFNKGNMGELLTYVKLEKLHNYKKLLTNNYILDENNLTHESDIIMIDNTGIYVFESKNYSGWIYGDETRSSWMQCIYNDETHKKYKTPFYNPIWQNKKHIKEINEYLDNKYENNIYSYIVFSNRCKLKKVKYSIEHSRVLNRNELLWRLKKDRKNRVAIFTNEEINQIYDKLKLCSNVDEAVKQKHIDDINSGAYYKNKYQKQEKAIINIESNTNQDYINIVSELKKYRKNKSENEKTKAYFIFSDETINNLATIKPRTIEELIKIKGMGNYNTQKYGNDILTIINKFN